MVRTVTGAIAVPGQNELLLRFDLPIDEDEARRRGIDPSCALMLVRPANRSIAIRAIAALVYACCPNEQGLFVCAINSFGTFGDAQLAAEAVTVIPELDAVATSSAEALAAVLSRWNAEAHVLFFGDRSTLNAVQAAARAEVPPWWRLPQGGHEARYLKSLEAADPFFFFAESHGSVEIVGTRQAVLRCFDAIPRSEGKLVKG